MRYWKDIVEENLSYEEAHKYIKTYGGVSYITRREWKGLHFYTSKNKKSKYCILLKDGTVIREPETIQCKDKKDWMIVTPTRSAIITLKDEGIITIRKLPL